jgi:hypothetical protein
MIDWQRLAGRTVFITGADKNAGKTTLLNFVLGGLRARGESPAFLSAGYDGEERDHLSGRPKPRVRALAGELVATTEAALETADAGLEILEVFPGDTVLGRPLLTRARRPGEVELIGPTGNRGLAAVLECLTAKYRPGTVLVDGAVDRITQVSSATAAHVAAYAMVLRAEPAALSRAVEIVRLNRLLSALPSPAEVARAQETIEVPGALTESRLKKMPADDRALLLEDFTKVFLSFARAERLCRERDVFLRRTFELLFFAVNLFDVSREEFLAALGEPGGAGDLVFNPYRVEEKCA